MNEAKVLEIFKRGITKTGDIVAEMKSGGFTLYTGEMVARLKNKRKNEFSPIVAQDHLQVILHPLLNFLSPPNLIGQRITTTRVRKKEIQENSGQSKEEGKAKR